MSQLTHAPDALLSEIRGLIDDARRQVAQIANSALTLTYWKIGKRIGVEILGGERAAYGSQIVVSLARQLEQDYGNGFGEKNLRRMIQFAEVFPDEGIVVSLIRQFVRCVQLADSLNITLTAFPNCHWMIFNSVDDFVFIKK